MTFFKWRFSLNPFIAILSSITILVIGLINAKVLSTNFYPNDTYYLNGSFYLLAVFILLLFYADIRKIIRVLLVLFVFGGIFSLISYFASNNNINSAISMFNRFGAIFVAIMYSSSIEPVRLTRSLNQIHCPRAITLGLLICTSFLPSLKLEVRRVREAMRTRGAGSILKPQILYRAFLIPFVMRLINISDTLSLSIETRGFTLDKVPYTVYKKEYFLLSDLVFLLVFIGINIGVFFL